GGTDERRRRARRERQLDVERGGRSGIVDRRAVAGQEVEALSGDRHLTVDAAGRARLRRRGGARALAPDATAAARDVAARAHLGERRAEEDHRVQVHQVRAGSAAGLTGLEVERTAQGGVLVLVDDADRNVGGEQRERRAEVSAVQRARGAAGRGGAGPGAREGARAVAAAEAVLHAGAADDGEVVRGARPAVVEVAAVALLGVRSVLQRDRQRDLLRGARNVGAVGAHRGDVTRAGGHALHAQLVDEALRLHQQHDRLRRLLLLERLSGFRGDALESEADRAGGPAARSGRAGRHESREETLLRDRRVERQGGQGTRRTTGARLTDARVQADHAGAVREAI